ncbi:S9 family peptidase [Cumulibacter manganitolerans]|uniref:S9 family peptidase n=1 Tax=Cumulibacter manganitolerans TaxID=1884992 RepID=UPI001296B020|nr:S9 family peptidase [Cumulibacter manganitolerans]
MQPRDLDKIRTLSSPTVDPSGRYVVFAVSRPDTTENRYVSSLWRVPVKGTDAPAQFTYGSSDSSPAYSPDGSRIAFLRADDDRKPQIWLIAATGGDARQVTSAPLGVTQFAWSPDGTQIAYSARVPEPGRYGTDKDVSPEQEAPRLIEGVRYLADGLGYLNDRPSKIFLVADLAGEGIPEARALTSGPGDDTNPLFMSAGARVGFIASRTKSGRFVPDTMVEDLCSVDLRGKKFQRHTPGTGSVARAVVDPAGDRVYVGRTDLGRSRQDFVARNMVWYRLGDDAPLTDPETDHAEPVAVATESGLIGVFSVRGDAHVRSLGDALATVLDGDVSATGVAASGKVVAVVASTPDSYGEIYVGSARSLTRRSSFAGSLTGTAAPIPRTELVASSTDDYPVHGWVLKPQAGKGPFPVVLMVHGGPYAQYTGNLFDEAQVLAGAGYAVVMCNPRGGAGYGAAHGRSLKGAIGTVDVDDILAFLDEALRDKQLDAKRVGIMGGSYGGLMTTWILGHSDRFVAGISERAVNAWDSFAGTSDIGWFFADEYAGSHIMSQSPLTHAGNIDTPMLIIHSERDFRCPLEQGQRLFALLQKRGVPSKLLIFPGEGHELSRSGQPRHRLQRFEHILDWWAEYLPTS